MLYQGRSLRRQGFDSIYLVDISPEEETFKLQHLETVCAQHLLIMLNCVYHKISWWNTYIPWNSGSTKLITSLNLHDLGLTISSFENISDSCDILSQSLVYEQMTLFLFFHVGQWRAIGWKMKLGETLLRCVLQQFGEFFFWELMEEAPKIPLFCFYHAFQILAAQL